MQKVVFFDLGGVVVDVDHARGANEFSRLTGLPAHEFDRAFFLSGVKDRLDVGTMSKDQALARVSELTGAAPELACKAMEAVLTVRPRVVNLAHAMAPNVRLGVISNTDPIHAAWIEREAELLPIIEAWTYSFLEGCLKPDPPLYLKACEYMNIAPKHAVLIDDRPENCATAKSLGMHAIQYETFEQVRSELVALGLHR